MKGQVSVELLVVVGFIVLLFIPLLLFVYYKAGELNRGIQMLQGRLLSSKLAFIANSLGYLGDGSSLKAEFLLPDQVSKLEFKDYAESGSTGGEVLITLQDGSQVSQVTQFPLSSAQSYGGGANYKLEFLSENGKIMVSPSN